MHDHPKTSYVRELIQTTNYKLFFFLVNNLSNKLSFNWYEIATLTLDYVIKFGGIWHLRGHSWEIEKEGEWSRLEKIFKVVKRIAKSQNVILMDNSQIVKRLQIL